MKKIAVVTGASGNLGQAIIQKMIAENYSVIGTAVPNDPVPLDFPGTVFEKQVVDLLDEDKSQQFINHIIDSHQRIDTAILAVGGFASGKIVDTKTSDVNKQYRLNFETAYNIARPVFTQMIKQNSGRIFLVGSKAGLDARNGKGMIAYSLGKSLLFHLAELMNDEAKGHDVVVSVIIPSTIDTPQNRKAMPDADPSKWIKPEAIADIIHFYCTDAASTLREPVVKVYNGG